MTKDNSTGKNKEFYDLGKAMFDRIQVLPEHQAMIQRGVDRTTPPFKPDYNTEAVLVEEMQRMAKRIEELEALVQPQRKPLTDDETDQFVVSEIGLDADADVMSAFARAIEAAHGIKENT